MTFCNTIWYNLCFLLEGKLHFYNRAQFKLLSILTYNCYILIMLRQLLKIFTSYYFSTDTCSFIVIFFFLGTSLALRLKDIDVPPHRVVGEKARLVCKFDMEGDILYSVKWYKDDLEFYRFVPNDRPKLQVFPQKGIHVDVSKIFIQNYFKGYNSCSHYL